MNNNITQAIKDIEQGKLVCFPTETVYALAANALNMQAIEKIYTIKGRDFNKPLALLLKDIASAKEVVKTNKNFDKLAKAFCPGPITFIMQKSATYPLPSGLNSGVDTIAVRIPKNDIALDILQKANCYIVATSVNPSGKKEATNAKQAQEYFGDKIETIIDGGECDLKVASTIVDLSEGTIKIVREGIITEEMIQEIIA